MAQRQGWASLGPLKGQNTIDNPLELGEGWATETRNVVIDPLTSLAVKRRGSDLLTLPAGTYLLAVHYPGGFGQEFAELWAFTEVAGTFGASRTSAGSPFTSVSTQPNEQVIRTLSFNGKLFMACSTGLGPNRMYCYGPGSIGVRLVGLGVSVAPTVANTGAGTYAAIQRWYKVDWVYVADGKTVSRSELSPASSPFTPSGTGSAARVTKPTTLEHASHWRVWASADDIIYRKISGNIDVSDTTYDDSVEPPDYTGDFPELVGTFLPPPAATRVMTDGNRVILAGRGLATSVTATPSGTVDPSTTRVWYTPVLGSLDQGDDERIPITVDQRNYTDIGNSPIGDITEIDGPLEGQIMVFTRNQPWRLIPTGDLVDPYIRLPITSIYGGGRRYFDQEPATALGENESGDPVIYFLDTECGLYRIDANNAIQFVSYDIQNEIESLLQTIDANSNPIVFSWPEQKQTWVLFSLGTGSALSPREHRVYVFHWKLGRVENGDTIRGGWTTWTIAAPAARMSSIVLYNRIPGTASRLGTSVVPVLLQRFSTTGLKFDRAAALDNATAYRGYVRAAPILPTGAQTRIRVGPPVICATSKANKSIRVTAIRDFGTETRSSDVSMSPQGAETRVIRSVEGLFQGDVTSLEVIVGDAEADSGLWQVDYLTVPVARQEPR